MAEVGDPLDQDTGMTATSMRTGRAVGGTTIPLVARARRGDRAALAELVDGHAELAGQVVRAIVGPSAPDADDLIQETLVRACERIGQCRGDDAFAAWIARIAQNVCRDHRRSAWQARVTLSDRVDAPGGPDGGEPEEALEIRRALGRLPARQRMVLILRFAHGRSFAEIGRLFGGDAEAARSRVRRALGRMRKMLGPDWEEDLP
jgi:RNA polymerase sigma-70 factor (ECF subfamily)